MSTELYYVSTYTEVPYTTNAAASSYATAKATASTIKNLNNDAAAMSRPFNVVIIMTAMFAALLAF